MTSHREAEEGLGRAKDIGVKCVTEGRSGRGGGSKNVQICVSSFVNSP